MSGEDRANNPARKPSFAFRATKGPYAGEITGYERGSTGDFLYKDKDIDAQIAFGAHGFNKGKAGDMAKNIQSNVDNSVERSKSYVKSSRDNSIRTIKRRGQ